MATSTATASRLGSSGFGGGFGSATLGIGGYQVPATREVSLASICERDICGAGEDAEGSPRCSNCGEVYGACAATSSAAYSGNCVGVREEVLAVRGLNAVEISRVDELAVGRGGDDGERGLSSSRSSNGGKRGVGHRLADSAALLADNSVLGSFSAITSGGGEFSAA